VALAVAATTLLAAPGNDSARADSPVPLDVSTSAYVPVGPLRLADTREPGCGCTRPAANTIRVDVTDRPDIDDAAVAAAVTVTALDTPTPGFVTAYPGGTERPGTSTVNTRTDRVVANSAIVPLGADGTLDVYSLLDGDVVVDVTGVFVPAFVSAAGRFVAAQPQRLLDTRAGGLLSAGDEVTVGLPPGVPADATALAVNVTSLDEPGPGFVSARPAGAPAPSPVTSFVNVDGTGQPVAAGVVLPAAPGGITLTTSSGGHLLVDLVGWFTGPSAGPSTDGLFVPVAPHRLLDTRVTAPRLWPEGTVELASPAVATALVTNLTVTEPDWQGFVTAYPAGTPRPDTSAVNPVFHDHTVANLAITGTSSRGLAYYGLAGTDLVVDMTGYFAGAPVAATETPPANTPRDPRVLLLGDSALAVLNVYTEARSALVGGEYVLDLENCRRLVHRSCLSNVTDRVPNTALEALRASSGPFDVVYIDVGHNDWHDADFAWQFDQVVQAARGLGADVILWATYTENVTSATAHEAYAENNAMLRQLTAQPQYPDVLLADWNAYAGPHPEWFWDGTHMRVPGAYAIAGYISEWVRTLTHR
jgi:hypothetical protein